MNFEPCTSKSKKRKKRKKGETCTSDRKEGDTEIVNESFWRKSIRRERRERFSSCRYSKHSVHSERVTY